MASWKDAPGQYLWGTYSNIGNYIKIYVVGGPGGGDSNYFYISNSDMDNLRSRNYGTGVHFWWEGNNLKITFNLIILTARDDYRFLTGDKVRYVSDRNTDYNFYANIQYQTRDGQWHKLGDHLVNTHYGGEPIYPLDGWDNGSGYLWNTFTFNDINTDNVKQFSVGIHGDFDEVGNWAYYPIEQIKPKEHTVTIRYMDRATNQEVSGSQTVKVIHGQTYSGQSKNVNNYTAEQPSFSFPVNNDMEYVVWYNKNVTYIRPWAIRKSGSWKSFKTVNSNMKIRVSSVFSNKSTDFDQTKAGETIPSNNLGNNPSVTQSSNYIRKSGSWKRQGKIGS